MNKKDFLSKMRELNVHHKFYSIDGQEKEYAFNILPNKDGSYVVFYLEKGESIDRKLYPDENSALLALLIEIEKELSYGSDLSGHNG